MSQRNLREELRNVHIRPWNSGIHDIHERFEHLDKNKLHVPIRRNLAAATTVSNKGKADTSKSKSVTYATYFRKVLKIRMKYYHRLSFMIALSFAVVLALPFRGSVFMYPVKVITMWAAFSLIKIARDSTLRVESSNASSEVQHVISVIFSSKCLQMLAAYLTSTFFIYSIIFFQSSSYLNYCISSTSKTVKPFLNDNFMFFWYFVFFVAIFYTFQFMVFEKNKLNFKISTYRSEPTEQLKRLHWTSFLKETASITGCITVLAGPIYLAIRNFLFDVMFYPVVAILNLNRQIPASRLSFSLYVVVCLVCFLVVFIYELLNKIYNAYAMAGCLIVKKPLSAYSEHPFEALMTGITNYKDNFVRLTAYQEIVYRSTAENALERKDFYDANNWVLALNEISKVIKESSRAAKMDLPQLKKEKLKEKKGPPAVKPVEPSIFGTLGHGAGVDLNNGSRSMDDRGSIFAGKGLQPDDLFLRSDKKVNKEENAVKNAVQSAEDALMIIIKKYEGRFVKMLKEYVSSRTQGSRFLRFVEQKLNSDLWDTLLSHSYRREADRRIPNKALVGNAIVAVSEMLFHAKSEDRKNVVEDSITEVLTLLTRIYRSTSEFMDNPPVRPRNSEQANNNSIKEINDLAISYFFKLVVFYNSSLNDLILSPETFRLAKWCTDIALEEQRVQKFE
ncbi:DEKNAAC100786 [Brettanomyces naardenensis]|uniref:DEKNAAC100786 n=1 Tax=Brettanomyces naardenensis TaxID=13370 RepID=A0A448YG34_BRENA|nr:DEKNAAC100786 [Brettanomyces naardenensis]